MWQLMQLSATELPTPKRLDVAQRAVRVVSQRVGHLVFAHRHVRHRSFGLRDLQPVARGALEGSAWPRRAAVPARVRAAVVSGEARLADFGGLQLRELANAPLCSSSTCAWPGP
jgi:hypothetical protein